MFRLPPNPARLKDAVKAKSGEATAKHSIVLKRKGEETVLREASASQPRMFAGTGEETAIAGVGFGLTIPGPEKSYMTARIDAFCYLPCKPTDEGVKAAMDRASDHVQKQIEAESISVQEFFAEMKR